MDVECLRGTTDDREPFEAFALFARRNHTRLGVAFNVGKRTVTQFVDAGRACAGINGGFYVTVTGAPLDWLVLKNVEIRPRTNPTRPCIFIQEGRALVAESGEYAGQATVLQAGPRVVRSGRAVSNFEDYRKNAGEFDCDITAARFPRTLFGMAEAHYVFLVVDGRSDRSAGLLLEECGRLCLDLGLRDAINLDGGGSSALVLEGRLLNQPRASPSQVVPAERPVPTALLAWAD